MADYEGGDRDDCDRDAGNDADGGDGHDGAGGAAGDDGDDAASGDEDCALALALVVTEMTCDDEAKP